MANCQEVWNELISSFKQCSSDEEDYEKWDADYSNARRLAKRDLARRLRQFADIVEADGYPDVFGCELPEDDPPCSKRLMASITVILSHPWPG